METKFNTLEITSWSHVQTKNYCQIIIGEETTNIRWNNAQIKKNVIIIFFAAAAAKLLQSCPTLCDPIDGDPPGSPVPGILQARTLEWVAISFCNAWKWKVKVKSLSRVWLFTTPWTAAHQAPPSMGFSRQEYWSGVPLPSLIFLAKIFTLLWGAKNYLLCYVRGLCMKHRTKL